MKLPFTTMNKVRTRAGAALAAALLLALPARSAEEKLVADIRADFPKEGEMYRQPAWNNGWVYYVARGGAFSEKAVTTWYQDETRWPDGLLSLYGTGPALAYAAKDRHDAIEVLPGDHENWLVARWTSTTEGKLRIRGTFRRRGHTPQVAGETDGIEFKIRHNEGDPVFTGNSGPVNDTAEKEFDLVIPDVKVGDPVDFIIRGINRNWGNETQVTAQIFFVE